jgi:hypothetical protein
MQNTSTTATYKDGEILDIEQATFKGTAETVNIRANNLPKVVPQPYSHFLAVLALFIPMPIIMDEPLFILKGYGFGFSIAFGRFIPLGWVMIIISLLI